MDSDYQDYLRSPEWKVKAEEIRKKQNQICGLCGKRDRLQIHHLTYARLRNEEDGDLIGLCQNCHSKIHAIASGYEQARMDLESSVGYAWRDAKVLQALRWVSTADCILCTANRNLNTSYSERNIDKDLESMCEDCQIEVFKIAASYSANYAPRIIALAYAIRDAKRNARYRALDN